MRLWDADSGKELRRFEGHRNGVSSVAYAANGKYVMSGSLDGDALIWQLGGVEESVAARRSP
jgi:WD40 repeat protein